ncbi:miniconductance mechanosensitive channel [Muriicola jejuensis]|uniref:Mechanosensing system component YbdG n=1 Tax=Muriicola jejuensis TaxID=504488 RepID=A0A6P0UE89_9FLAO|nr:mechanosensitive ion channel domain-containing protein [Muriicola jejuensis]NER11591.1 mechanosensitive ion channel [Muriicola jejuensis]SMP19455.1 miniconductance mechanosensitive channel [Muriicola jejuensis]
MLNLAKNLSRIVYDFLIEAGLSETLSSYLNLFILLIASVLFVWALDFTIWKVLRWVTVVLAKRTRTNFDNFLVLNRVPLYIAHILPLVVLFELMPIAFVDFELGGWIAEKILKILIVVLTIFTARAFLRAVRDYLKTKARFKDKPIDSFIQVFMILAWIVGILAIIFVITELEIWKFFTALGAGSAIVLLIFKDSILGLVASIQVSINDMVRIGDWITFEKYEADGNIIEITLATVKVQNFDRTITTIPTYSLISDSFKNWRGMQMSDGRRIKRALIISQKSIRFLSTEDVEELKRIQLITKYLDTRSSEIDTHNALNKADKSLAINGRNLTNLGVFRKYVLTYLESQPVINKKMSLMVRQLEPTPQGIPLEIYAFIKDKRWENYEYIVADIFDHLLSALPYFKLELYELPVVLNKR